MNAYVGCRTTRERGARGEGLGVYRIDDTEWTRVQTLPLVNPSFLAFGPGRRTLYTVHGDGDTVTALRAGAGPVEPLNAQLTGGRNPVHLAFDRTGRFLVVANYATGTVAALPVAPDGSLHPVCSLLPLPGQPGPHRTDQACSHPHQVLPSPDGRFLVVPDKGLDRCFVLSCDAVGALAIVGESTGRPGAGPRHAAFHPALPLLYVANELDSSVTTCRFGEDGGLLLLQVLPTLPPDWFGASTVAAIVATPCGGFVYVSNRGHDSIAAFAVERGGTLRPLGWTPSLGNTPRFMTLSLSGRTLLVANETSDTIVAFTVAAGGQLVSAGTRAVTGSPVCLLFDAD